MQIDLLLWAACFAALWFSHYIGRAQGSYETTKILETTLKKLVDETEDEFKSEFLQRLIQKLRVEIARFKNETLSE